MSTPNNPAEVLRAYIKEIVPAEELPSDFDARMDAMAAYCDEVVEVEATPKHYTQVIEWGRPDVRMEVKP